jgi:hypothetical protein
MDWTPVQVSEWSGLFSVKRLLQCWTIGVVAVFVSGALMIAAPSVGLAKVFTFPLWLLPTLVGIANSSVLMFLVASVFLWSPLFRCSGAHYSWENSVRANEAS